MVSNSVGHLKHFGFFVGFVDDVKMMLINKKSFKIHWFEIRRKLKCNDICHSGMFNSHWVCYFVKGKMVSFFFIVAKVTYVNVSISVTASIFSIYVFGIANFYFLDKGSMLIYTIKHIPVPRILNGPNK